MYQGVFNQCTGVAHKFNFSDYTQSAELFLFTLQYLRVWGILTIPYIFQIFAAFIWGIYHPIYFSMGHSSFPLLAAFIAHQISHSYVAQNFTWGTFPSHFIMRYLAFPFSNFLFLDSWGTCPSHSHLQL